LNEAQSKRASAPGLNFVGLKPRSPSAKTRAKLHRTIAKNALILCALILCLPSISATAQKTAWRQASEAELALELPSQALVEKERIETEMRTASGIVNGRRQFIAGVVLLTAGYSADGKYSHYLLVQVPIRVGGVRLKPGEYAFGWTRAGARAGAEDALSVHFNVAATGDPVGTAQARRIAGSNRVESLHIWPPEEKSLIQIGRFGIPYELGKD
jgi:hypothetical protein